MNLLDETLGNLARDIPGATALFHDYRLDFCWHGDRSLETAARERGLEPARLVADLEVLTGARHGNARDWRRASTAELIDHILSRYHERHREQLPALIHLAQRVERVHADHPECPAGLTDHLLTMQQELENHMIKEERVLFPMLADDLHGKAQAPISVMRHEHDQHGEDVARLCRLTHDMIAPEGACNSWRSLYQDLRSFCADLMDHIHIENHILFAGLNEAAAGYVQPDPGVAPQEKHIPTAER